MKPQLLLLASVIIATPGWIPSAPAGYLSPRQVEENPALVRSAGTIEQKECRLCTLNANRALRRSPRAIEENPELSRTTTCSAEVFLKAPGVSTSSRTPPWPRILENR